MNSFLIGLYDAPGVEKVDSKYPSELIYEYIEKKMNSDEREKFNAKRYESAEALEDYQVS